MTFEITIKKCGAIIDRVQIAGQTALEAINQIEARYQQRNVSMLNNSRPATVVWTGYEFTARRV